MRDLRESALEYGIIAFTCMVTSCRVGCGCTVRSFTTGVKVEETRGDILNFCVNVRGSKCEPKSYVNRNENTLSGYHVDLELSDRSRE